MNEELKIIIRAELEQFKKAMREAVSGINQVARTSKNASKEIDGFTADVNQQGRALSDLKKKYVDLAAAHGRESKAAKDAAEQIKKLSAEYRTNKNLAATLANEANGFDVSLVGDDANKNVEATKESMTELQGTLQNLYTLNIWEFVGDHLDNWKKKAKDFSETAKSEFDLAAVYMEQAFKEFAGDEEMLKDLDAVGESFGERVKGSMVSLGEGFKSLGASISASFKAIMAGLIASAAILIADIVVIVGLTKNALAMAKQIKQQSAEASKLGLTTQSYNEWSYVLEQVGVGADKLSDFLKTLADEQNAVRDGSEDIIKAFEALGMTQEEVMGMDQATLFQETVKGLQNIESATERTSIAYRIFGEDAAELANVLYLTNQETKSLVDNYYALGAAPSDNLITKSKELTGSTTNLSYAWQGLKNTLAEWVIPAVIAVVQWITTAVAYVNAFLQGIFGVEVATKGASEGLSGVGAGIGNIGNNAENSTKAIKELLRYTMGFDELNVVPKQSSSSGSGAGGANAAGGYSNAAINPEIPVIEVPDISKFRAFMEEYGSIIQGILTWAGVLGGIALMVAGIMTGNIPMIVGGVSVLGLGIAIGAAGGEESHWAKFAEGLSTIFGGLVEKLKKSWDAIVGAFSAAWSLIQTIWSGFGPFFELLWLRIKTIFIGVSAFFGGVFGAAWEGIKFYWGVAVDFFASIWDSIAGVFSLAESVLRSNFEDAWTAIQGIVGSWGDFFVGVWEGIKNAFGNVASWFENIFSKAWRAVKDVFSTGGEIFTGITEGIGSLFKNVVNKIIGGLNLIIAVPFKTINKTLNKIRGIEFLGISPFKTLWGENPLTVPVIPQLAKGGIATRSILANIGEAGKEAVLPLENNTGWMDVLAARINGGAPSKIVLMVDGKELGYAAINNINSITRQSGQLQLQLV